MPSLEDLTHEDLLKHTLALKASDDLFKTLLTSPDTREETLRLMKKKNPNLILPEIDQSDRVMKAVEVEAGKREALEAKIMERDIRDRIEKERDRVKKAYGLTNEEVLEVEKVMTDKDNPIPNYDGAARVFKASRTPSEPTAMQISSPTYDMPDGKTWAPGIGNMQRLNKIFLEEATKVVNEGLAARAA